ncbi:hypothetical protein C8R44DRAFT_846698 [Mycena epipterygia]|nr:hypothetical protein C8R44DRAFT_846698 [Mycena epipterygia]
MIRSAPATHRRALDVRKYYHKTDVMWASAPYFPRFLKAQTFTADRARVEYKDGRSLREALDLNEEPGNLPGNFRKTGLTQNVHVFPSACFLSPSMRERHATLRLSLLALTTARLARAQNNNNGNSNHVILSFPAVAFVAAAVCLFLLCCGIQRRRIQRVRAAGIAPPPLPLTHAGSGFPHGIQYGSPPPRFSRAPGQYPYTPSSEYPAAGAADFAPPPYVKEGADGMKYPPPLGPPPGIDAAYSPPPGPPPPPPAHTRPGSTS